MDDSEQKDEMNQQPDATDEPDKGEVLEENNESDQPAEPTEQDEPVEEEAMVANPAEVEDEVPGSEPVAVDEALVQSPLEVETTEETISAIPTKSGKKKMIIVVVLVLLALAAAAAVWWLMQDRLVSKATGDKKIVESTIVQRMGASLASVSGVVEYSMQPDVWQEVKDGTVKLEEGNSVRTNDNGRAVLALEDGSEVRLDGGTTVKLASLANDDIKIEQVAGKIYSRVVTSERKYSVLVDSVVYEAMGTAFVTTKSQTENGVIVIESKVRASGLDKPVEQGKQYFHASKDKKLKGVITDADIRQLAEDGFVEWNLSEDEKKEQFKDKLGVLAEVKLVKQEKIDATKKADETAKREADKKTDKKKRSLPTDKKEEDKKTLDKNRMMRKSGGDKKVKRGEMHAWFEDGHLNWAYSGEAVHGYRIVYSDHNKIPLFGQDKVLKVDNVKSSVLRLTNFFRKYKTYYVRVCAFTNGTDKEPCVDYSKAVTIRLV